MNNNNTRMELVDEKAKEKQERQEKREKLKRKFSEKLDVVKNNVADFKDNMATRKRIREQEKAIKHAKTTQTNTPQSSFQEQTITNETIMNRTPSKGRKQKRVLTEQEKRQRKNKWQRIFRNIMTIPEIILIVLLVIFLKDKYIAYSKNVHQTLIYQADKYEYEIKRDNDAISVIKKQELNCKKDPCEKIETDKYEVKFSKKQMIVARVYFDVTFRFKSKKKTIKYDQIKSDFGKRSIRGIIHNDAKFLDTKLYKKYKVADYEQLSEHENRGFIYEKENDRYYLTIALGEKQTSGYGLVVPEAHKVNGNVIFYFKEQTPESGEVTNQVITHPVIKLELEESAGDVRVIEVDTGEELKSYDELKTIKPTK